MSPSVREHRGLLAAVPSASHNVTMTAGKSTGGDDFGTLNDENISKIFIHGVKVLHFEIGLGWDHFWGGVSAQSTRVVAEKLLLLDILPMPIMPSMIDLINTLGVSIPPHRSVR